MTPEQFWEQAKADDQTWRTIVDAMGRPGGPEHVARGLDIIKAMIVQKQYTATSVALGDLQKAFTYLAFTCLEQQQQNQPRH